MRLDEQPASLVTLDQAGVWSRQQAIAAGFSTSRIRAQISSGRWQRIHAGVYATFSGPIPPLALVWAALLGAGPGAAVGDATALRLFGLSSPEADRRIHVCVDHGCRLATLQGVVIRRRRQLDAVVHPSRSPRTVWVEDAALHRAARSSELSQGLGVLADVIQQRLTTAHRMRAALESLPRLKDRTTFRQVLDDIESGAHSFLELRYLRDVERAHRLPRPRRQASAMMLGNRIWLDGEYDAWDVRLELDGRLGHDRFTDQLRDRRRDLVAAGQGKVTIRSGYADVVVRSCETAALVAAVLRWRGWDGQPTPCSAACRLPDVMGTVTAGCRHE